MQGYEQMGTFFGGKRAAVSLSFDDARPSQIDCGLELFERLGVKATFYMVPKNIPQRAEGWKRMVAFGHEMGNHTLLHPCTGNFPWSRERALEDYTLERMAGELDGASDAIEAALGMRPATFAYPCGQTFVGRGAETRSYVPLIAERFVVGRGYMGEAWNEPGYCDMAQVAGFGMDALSFEQMRDLVDGALDQKAWAVLCGHDIGTTGRQTTLAREIEKLIEYCRSRATDVTVGTVAEIGRNIHEARLAHV